MKLLKGALYTLAVLGALAGFGWYVRDLSRFSVHGSIAAVVVFPLALWLGHNRRGADIAGAVVNIGRAIPSFGRAYHPPALIAAGEHRIA